MVPEGTLPCLPPFSNLTGTSIVSPPPPSRVPPSLTLSKSFCSSPPFPFFPSSLPAVLCPSTRASVCSSLYPAQTLAPRPSFLPEPSSFCFFLGLFSPFGRSEYSPERFPSPDDPVSEYRCPSPPDATPPADNLYIYFPPPLFFISLSSWDLTPLPFRFHDPERLFAP